MQEAEEQDTCRICSAPAEPDQPLFHPCKCSGTIRYIHQDCLTTWLAHSKKKTCDVCKHQYSFTKVYAPDMPSSLPPLLMIRRLIQQGFYAMLMVIRAIVVSLVWLSFLPLLTVWSWRMYFSMGDSTAWWISNRQPPDIHNESRPANNLILRQIVDFTHSYLNDESPPPAKTSVYTFFARILRHPAWISLSADIFTGQIIAALIVITFVAIFLLREWIAQNARPGLFDDDENLAQEILQVPPAQEGPELLPANAAIRLPPAPRMDANARLVMAHRQIEAVRALDALRADGPLTEEEKREKDQRALALGRSAVEFAPARSALQDEELDRLAHMRARKRRSEKGKEREEDGGDDGDKDDSEDRDLRQERMKRRNFARRLQLARQSKRKQLEPRPADPAMVLPVPESSTAPHTPPPPSSFFPSVALERPNGSIPFSFVFPPPQSETCSASTNGISSGSQTSDISTSSTSTNSSFNGISFGSQASFTSSVSPPSSSPSPTLDTLASSVITEPPYNASISRPGTPIRRPPLPNTLACTPGDSSSVTLGSHPSGSSTPMVKTPPASPSLAIYRAPEELVHLENTDYFAGQSTAVLDTVGEQRVEEDDDSETLDGNDANQNEDEDREDGLILRADLLPLGERGLVENLEVYFQDGTADEMDESDDEDSDAEAEIPAQVVAQDGGPQVQIGDVVGIAVDEEEEEEEDDDEEEEEEEEFDDIPALVPRRQRGGQQNQLGRAAVAFEAGPGLRRMVAIDGNDPAALPPAQGPQPQPRQGAADNIAEDDALMVDDIEAGVEDDMDGAMEAIGLRGPIYGLLQNAALMIFIMDTVIGLGIWVPYTLGKTSALLLLEPRRLLFILHLPIRAIRIITDPVVDLVAYLVTDLLLPPCLQIIIAVGQWMFDLSIRVVTESLGQASATKARESCLTTFSVVQRSVEPLFRILGFTGVSPDEVVASIPESVISEPTFSSQTFSTFIDYAEPYFAPLGKEVRSGYGRFGEVWTHLAVGDGPAERIFSVLFGYCIVASILALYLNVLTIGNVKTAGRAVRSAVRQQLLVLKVASFIFIELFTFPLGCGVVLDICTLWLFPGASYASRMEFLSQAPLTTVFYHWVAGTMFMYSFAVLLSGCRSVMRPGAMWFIKDPQDQNLHPIRDILDRPALVQLRKIAISGVMYATVVVCTVCSVAALLVLGRHIVLPFRWKTREPLSNVPIDLLFLNLALPYTMTYFRPRKTLKRIALVIWKGLARRLRLTSYFFGKRHGAEEYTPKNWSLSRIIRGPSKDAADAPVLVSDYDGTFRRVPNTDDIAIPREMPVTVAVLATGEPVDEAGRTLMTKQDAETIKAKRNIKDDFTVVYIPPYFRYRVIFFIFLLWSFGALCLGISLALPVLLGRGFFNIIFNGRREVHDGYSIIAGFYMLWACWIVGKAVDRLDKRRQRWGTEGPRASLWWLVVKRGSLWLVKVTYMSMFLGFVLPALVGIVVELYLILPFKLHLSPDIPVPRIRVLDCWATGLLYMKIAMRVTRRQANNPISRAIQTIKRNGWTHPDPISATKDVIGPVAGGLTGMILLPPLLVYSANIFFPFVGRHVDKRFLFTYVYSSLFCLAGFTHTFLILRAMLASWSQAVRDKEFLVEMRLRNHDPLADKAPTPVPEPKPVREQDVIMVGDEALDFVQDNRDV
ncbi:hypothetical protein BDP27DRAFT_1310544 [Rhodocollybia butyracea]|uniref:RING-type E3 ubiquitin transferase n=1 Tax=Rhodocollybia butyracea TaxID=206335 RepID=A0A9P5Q4K8_9AGAR|nr:hypothetical protein BDP27DRAFT_1310544 [Rhodocollybia butyracea]